MNEKEHQLGLTGLLGAALILTSACSSSPVKPSEKDVSGQFDGSWLIQVDSPVSTKQLLPGNWIANCGWKPFDIPIKVDDGVLTMTGGTANTPVGKRGRFLLEAPTDTKARQNSGVLPGDQSMTLIFKGNLSTDQRDGTFTRGVAAFQNNGCKANFTIRDL